MCVCVGGGGGGGGGAKKCGSLEVKEEFCSLVYNIDPLFITTKITSFLIDLIDPLRMT